VIARDIMRAISIMKTFGSGFDFDLDLKLVSNLMKIKVTQINIGKIFF